jgi:hypothetical protein
MRVTSTRSKERSKEASLSLPTCVNQHLVVLPWRHCGERRAAVGEPYAYSLYGLGLPRWLGPSRVDRWLGSRRTVNLVDRCRNLCRAQHHLVNAHLRFGL